MSKLNKACGLGLPAIFLVALSLSIGWGIRGNFGHESGAMIPGALAAIAVCLLSGREDWRRRVHYFALFGGLGWGFGGSIAYMYPISFSGSEHLPSSWYGFVTLFIEGGLWAGIGGAGTALAATLDRKRLNEIIVPMCFVLGMMILGKLFIEGWAEKLLETAASAGSDDTWNRQKSPTYWFDADWFPALIALTGVCLFDLWDRRFAKAGWLAVLAPSGALIGYVVQRGLDALGWSASIAKALVVPLGDTSAINPATGKPFSVDNMLTNWPQFFGDFPRHLGWGFGLLIGIGVYFALFGQWRRGSRLFLYMSLGWLIAFIVMPVLGTIPLQSHGGFRMMPPRSDDWAGVVGVFVAIIIYCMRNGIAPVAVAGSITAVLGGISFATVPFVRALLRAPGHAFRTPGGTPPEWAHYQSANWHSFLEQWHGFGHGIAIAVAMGYLVTRLAPHDDDEFSRPRLDSRSACGWRDVLAVSFVLFFITLMNVFKNVPEWVGDGNGVVPASMTMPLIKWIEWDAMTWFMITWMAISIACTALMAVHLRRRLGIVPESWTGKGQLMYIVLLWIMVIANFERALPHFSQGRLITEWVIFMNAALATFLVVFLPGKSVKVEAREPASYGAVLRRTWTVGSVAALVLMTFYALAGRWVYGDAPMEGPSANHKRFGPEAHWRIKPILKNEEHR